VETFRGDSRRRRRDKAKGTIPALDRRDALRRLAGGAIGAAAAPWVESLSALAHQQAHAHAAAAAIAAQDWTPRVLTARQNELVTSLAELIIPETDTHGARAARVNRFIDTVLSKASATERERFLRGLAWIDERSTALFQKPFESASAQEQTALLTRVSAEDKAAPEDRVGVEFFQAIKAMTIDGYYTSEIGLMKELGDDGVLAMGIFRGCDHPEHQ
jgi:hypothetical protein